MLVEFESHAQRQTITITGKVVGAQSEQPIEYATVSIVDRDTETPVTGLVTKADGTFLVETKAEHFYIEISFMGFVTQTLRNFEIHNNSIDLKVIALEQNLRALDEIVVRAEKSQTEFKLEKRIFHVGTDLSSTGASALEVLNNVPSVNVNIEGEISLRGSQGVQILINGKPSVLATADGNALGTITADMIESIEVITNPSAKYNAEGTAGIINIIIKKSENRGLNGSASANVGDPKSNSIGLSLNKRTEHFNLFSQLGFGIRSFPQDNTTLNRDIANDTTIRSNGRRDFDEKFKSIILGTDYHIDDYNVVTLSGNYTYENEDQPSEALYEKAFGANTVTTDSWERQEQTKATNPKLRYELLYKRDFKRHEDQELLFSALGNSFRKDQTSQFTNTTITGNEADFLQETRTDYALENYIFKLDYTHPFLKTYTLETGAQYEINIVSNDYAVSDFENGVWIDNPDLTNVFDFDQNVLAIYSTLAYEGDIWGIKIGLRLEDTDISTLLKTDNTTDHQNYTNLFPSVHTSYNVNDQFSVQLGYSRRINRPGLRQLNPFNNIRNNFNISRGNPDLLPEYTDSYELTSIHKMENIDLNFSLYHRYTTDVVEQVVSIENNISTRQPENIGNNTTTGFEFNGKYDPFEWFTLSGDFNINYFKRMGEFETQDFDFKGNRWSTRVNSKFELPLEFDLEISGHYHSKFVSLQGEESETYFVDTGIRKKIFKGKVILNLSIRDLFETRIDKSFSSQADFYSSSSRKRGRFITFGISYGFGKGEAMEFSGQRIH